MPTILIVCTANVCRSQFARGLMIRALNESPGLSVLSVESSGTTVAPTLEPCSLAQEMLTGVGADLKSNPMLNPRALTVDHVANADLILTAERSHRAAVTRLDPKARLKTFTLVEASLLASSAFDNGHFDLSAESMPDRRFSLFACQLNATRGVYAIQPPPAARRRVAQSVPEARLDIDDGHNGRQSQHAFVLRQVADVVDEIVTALNGTMSPQSDSLPRARHSSVIPT